MVFLCFRLQYLNIVCQIECSHQQQQFVCYCYVQHFSSALTYLRLIENCDQFHEIGFGYAYWLAWQTIISRQKNLGYHFHKIDVTVPQKRLVSVVLGRILMTFNKIAFGTKNRTPPQIVIIYTSLLGLFINSSEKS